MLAHQIDDRRADDDTVGHATDRRRLFRGTDAEADRDRQMGRRLQRATASSIEDCTACCCPVMPATET